MIAPIAESPNNVLVVSDRVEIRSTLAHGLLQMYDVWTQSTALGATTLLHRESFGAVLTTESLQGGSGRSLLRFVRWFASDTQRFIISKRKPMGLDQDMRSGLIHGWFPDPLDLADVKMELEQSIGSRTLHPSEESIAATHFFECYLMQ